MTVYLVAYIATALVFLVIDLLWLGVIARTFYRDALGPLMADTVHTTAALGFYLIYILGIVFFAVRPGLAAGQWTVALSYGAAFGFFCYATYNFTNLATLRDWPSNMIYVDLAWGTVLTGLSAAAGAAAARAVT